MMKKTYTISKQNTIFRQSLFLGTVLGIGICGLILAFAYFIKPQNDKKLSSEELELQAIATGLPVELEVQRLPSFTPLPSLTPTQTRTSVPTITPIAQATLTPIVTVKVTAIIQMPTMTESTIAQCDTPTGWVAHQVQDGDTLFAFQLGAGRAGNPATVEDIMQGNCLESKYLTIGQILWLPEGAVDNAPSSEPQAPNLPSGTTRTAKCPCTLTVREGWRIEQIADEINRNPVAFTGADFLAFTRQGAPIPARNFLASVPASAGLEGFMFPGTYTLQNDTTAEQFRDMLLNAFEANASGLLGASGNFGMTPYDLVKLASVIQRESYSPQEQPLVASVFHNRLGQGKGLGASVTLQYALGRYGNWWPRLQAGQTSIDTPYNTNIYGGLTPTAISNPGLSALQAAASPAQTTYVYFTGNCQGTGNAYAETYEQHLANVRCE